MWLQGVHGNPLQTRLGSRMCLTRNPPYEAPFPIQGSGFKLTTISPGSDESISILNDAPPLLGVLFIMPVLFLLNALK